MSVIILLLITAIQLIIRHSQAIRPSVHLVLDWQSAVVWVIIITTTITMIGQAPPIIIITPRTTPTMEAAVLAVRPAPPPTPMPTILITTITAIRATMLTPQMETFLTRTLTIPHRMGISTVEMRII